ncbi:hypothetical protein, partial [Paracraurococcus ruber]|uniref:hypothetical protein n=1 Tax=Paracraurococcus ruber TaxID=77675 RepID=UPI001961A835
AALLLALGLGATILAPPSLLRMPAGWPGPHSAWRLLRDRATRRAVLAEALPGGAAIGLALGLAMAVSPAWALPAAIGARLLLALPVPAAWRAPAAAALVLG